MECCEPDSKFLKDVFPGPEVHIVCFGVEEGIEPHSAFVEVDDGVISVEIIGDVLGQLAY